MGFIDALYILDGTQFPIFHYCCDPSVPSFSYVRNQLQIAKRELFSKDGVPDDDLTLLCENDGLFQPIYSQFTESSTMDINCDPKLLVLDPVVKLDSNWVLSWCKMDDLYLVAIGENPDDYLDVVSDEETEDTDDEDDSSSEEDQDSIGTNSSNENEPSRTDTNMYVKREEYTSLWDNESKDAVNANSSDILDSTESVNKQDIDKSVDSIMKGVSTITNTQNPLQYIKFLDVFSQAIKIMLQSNKITTHKVQINAHRIVMLLQELYDASIPFVSDMNQLRELLPNDSIVAKLVSATKQFQNTAANSLSGIKKGSIQGIASDLSKVSTSGNNTENIFNYQILLERSGSRTPWRTINPRNSQNEIFVDLFETVELVVEPKKSKNLKHFTSYSHNSDFSNLNSSSFSRASIHGHLDLTTSLSGTPTVEIQLSSPLLSNYSPMILLDDCYPTLHKAVDRQVWVNSNNKILELVPPDEKSKILTYNIDLLELKDEINNDLDITKYTGSIAVELHSGLGINRNEFEIVVNTGCGMNNGFGNGSASDNSSIKEIENLTIDIFLPDSAAMAIENPKHVNSKSIQLTKKGQMSGLLNEYGANEFEDLSYNDEDIQQHKNGSVDSLDMKVLRSSSGTVVRTANGNYEWKLDSNLNPGSVYTLRGSIGQSLENAPDNHRKPKTEICPKFLSVNYKHHGSVPSGLKIQSIKVLDNSDTSIKSKPFKGVKYTCNTGEYLVR